MQYTDGNHNSATVEIRATHKDNVSLTYVFNGVEQTDKVKTFSSDFTETLNVVIKGSDGRQIKLEPIDFWWNTHGGFKERKGTPILFFPVVFLKTISFLLICHALLFSF
eukprot:Pgem_evm1s12758